MMSLEQCQQEIKRQRQVIESYQACIGTIRELLGIQPIRNGADLDVERHSKEIVGQISTTIEQLEGRVKALEGALKGMLRFKTLVGYAEYRKAQAALSATGEEGHEQGSHE